MEQIKLTNDKGNVGVKARGELKKFATDALVEFYTAKFGADAIQLTNKGVVVQIGVDFMTGQGIFIAIDPVVTMNAVAKEAEKKAKAPVEADPIANPFA